MKRLFYVSGLVLILLTSCREGERFPYGSSVSEIEFPGIKGKVADAGNGNVLSARIIVREENGSVLSSYYKNLPGFFTEEDGSFSLELQPGKYSLSVFHGIDYLSQNFEFEIEEQAKGFEFNVFLEPWEDLRAEGWVSGGGHCHLYTGEDKDDEMIATVRKICLAQGIDFVCAAQGWAGYGDSNWREGYARFSDDRFLMHYGSEMPKYRTGHTWWIGQTSTLGYFNKTMDVNYEEKYYRSESGTEWSFSYLDFPYIPDVEIVQGFKRLDNAAAIMPHPTSWWWQERGAVTKYTTNVCSYLSFGLLSGMIWDGLVVMGYNHDHYHYQNLWFNILNLGYRMPAISELDGGLGKNDRFYYGSMRTYYKLEGDFSIPAVADAVRRGETFVSSGPIIKANIDDNYRIGDIIRCDDKEHELNIKVLASGDRDDYISYLVVYRNGEIFLKRDLREQKLRSYKETVSIKESRQAWYVIKAYGRKAWEDPENLDIMKVCDKTTDRVIPPYDGDLHDVCITSPFYFRPEGVNDPAVLESEVSLSLVDENGKPVGHANIDLLVDGSVINSFDVENGNTNFNMPVHALLKIKIPGKEPLYRGLYLDYEPHRDLIEKLASGRWMNDYGENITFNPGEVPWEAFNFQETKKLLKKVNWEIECTPHPGDHLWEEFREKFRTE